MIVNYTMQYLEAVALHKVTSQNIAHELVLLFSHVGIPGAILTDQGAPFVSQLMQGFCRLLPV